jgi:Kef-type K+ transport system membrane component KefB/nucleotide-binding universal stress UspA family protein
MEVLIHDPFTRFIAQVAVIILAARLLGLGARWLGQPMVIAEITAGILLGPSLLGWLAPGTYQAIFPADSLELLSLVSQLGLIFFMFLVGLELEPGLLRGRGHASVVISHTSIVVPFGLGMLLALYLRPRLSDASVSFLAFSLFLGAAMSITAFPVLARILTERRLLRTRVGALTIACAAVDDVTAWCILAFVVAAARATGLGGAVQTTALALAYIGAMIFVVRPFLVRIAARIATPEGLTQNHVAVTILLLLASSWATELIGIHALFGAFLFGAILPKDGGFARSLAEKLEDLVLVVLLPLFFAYSGVRTQIGLLDSVSAWLMCGVIIITACVGKFAASTLAARLTGLGWREAGALGVLMNTRGLMELIVLNIGLDLGVISPTLFAMMVVMALVTTFMTTPVLQAIYPTEQMTRDLLLAAQPAGAAPAVTGPGLTTLLCVAYGGSGAGLVGLARTVGSAVTYALHLVVPSDRGSFRMDRDESHAASALEPVLARAAELSFEVKPLSFVSSEPADDISKVAEMKGADLILIGWHKPVLSRKRLGGTVYKVMQEASADVGVFVDQGLERARRVLVPFLGSPHDRAALALANRIADAEVTILHVLRPGRGERSTAQLDPRATMRVVEHADPAAAALAESGAGYDLVIVGVGREWGLAERPFGIRPEELLFECPTSILVVHRRSA